MENTDTDADSGQSTDDAAQTKSDEHAHQNQEQTIPKWRLDQVLGEVRQLKEQNENLAKQNEQTASKPQEFTTAQLDQFVEEGKITQTQATEQIVKQAKSQSDVETNKLIEDRVSQGVRETKLNAEMDAYMAKVPSLSDQSSDAFARVSTEYNYQTDILGSKPDTIETQLASIRSVFGPVESLGANKKSSASFESHQETGSSGGDQELHGDDKDLGWNDLSSPMREHYTDAIKAGRYEDRKAVLEEVNEFGNPIVLRRHGTRAK